MKKEKNCFYCNQRPCILRSVCKFDRQWHHIERKLNEYIWRTWVTMVYLQRRTGIAEDFSKFYLSILPCKIGIYYECEYHEKGLKYVLCGAFNSWYTAELHQRSCMNGGEVIKSIRTKPLCKLSQTTSSDSILLKLCIQIGVISSRIDRGV